MQPARADGLAGRAPIKTPRRAGATRIKAQARDVIPLHGGSSGLVEPAGERDPFEIVIPRDAAETTSGAATIDRWSPLPISRKEIILLRAHLGRDIDALLFDGDIP
jgi:hypothetical protein